MLSRMNRAGFTYGPMMMYPTGSRSHERRDQEQRGNTIVVELSTRGSFNTLRTLLNRGVSLLGPGRSITSALRSFKSNERGALVGSGKFPATAGRQQLALPLSHCHWGRAVIQQSRSLASDSYSLPAFAIPRTIKAEPESTALLGGSVA